MRKIYPLDEAITVQVELTEDASQVIVPNLADVSTLKINE